MNPPRDSFMLKQTETVIIFRSSSKICEKSLSVCIGVEYINHLFKWLFSKILTWLFQIQMVYVSDLCLIYRLLKLILLRNNVQIWCLSTAFGRQLQLILFQIWSEM